MTVHLGCSRGEPYTIDDEFCSLDEAIELEAETIAAAAGADLLESPDQDCRDLFRDQVTCDMIRALRGPGDTYIDPSGVTYTLYEKDDQPQPQEV